MLPGISPQYLYLHRYAFVSQVENACQDRFPPLQQKYQSSLHPDAVFPAWYQMTSSSTPRLLKKNIWSTGKKDFFFPTKVAGGGGTKSVPAVPMGFAARVFGEVGVVM